jgi:asparagine synthase (glutamine-hydrolysing)
MRRFLGSVDLLSGTVRATDYVEYDRVVELFGAYPYPALRALTLGRAARAVLSRECLRGIGDFDPLEQLARTWSSRRLACDDALSATQDFLFRTQLPSYILNCLGDRMEMANSVEGRLPFLDHKLAEFAFGLPRSLKVRDGQGKVLLREALGQSHPAYRAAKKVFASPAATLDLRNGKSPLARYLDRRVTEECGIFSPAMLRVLKHAQPLLRKGSNSRLLCEGLLTFAISVHALHELFCSNFMGSVQRFERHLRSLSSQTGSEQQFV